ncbi:hypothetical protein JW964_07150 [candidate division KSB1 bacterium]|nr:hypothetical protein [candidate division KSB1 bacterium]
MAIDIKELSDIATIELHLMTTAYYLGEYAAIQPLMQSDSRLAMAIQNQDLKGTQKIGIRLILDINSLDETQQNDYEILFQKVEEGFKSTIEKRPLPLPEAFINDFIEMALKKEKYLSAHNILHAIGKLEKKVNETIHFGLQQLQAKIVADAEKELSGPVIEIIDQAVQKIYSAQRLLKPWGFQFQYRALDKLTQKDEIFRKYEKYIEQSLLKEIIDVILGYLLDDQTIAEKVLSIIKSNKARKYFIKKLCIIQMGGEVNYQKFVKQYTEGIEQLKTAQNALDYTKIQTIFLGRTTGSDSPIQYFKEIGTRFPIAPLLLKIENSPFNTPYLAPIMLNDQSLLHFLDLEK